MIPATNPGGNHRDVPALPLETGPIPAQLAHRFAYNIGESTLFHRAPSGQDGQITTLIIIFHMVTRKSLIYDGIYALLKGFAITCYQRRKAVRRGRARLVSTKVKPGTGRVVNVR